MALDQDQEAALEQQQDDSQVVPVNEREDVGRINDPVSPPSMRDKWCIDLVNGWAKHHGHDLRLRFETGRELNNRLGPPEKRLERYAGVVEALAAELQMHKSELSRMRNFAMRFSSLKAFQMEHSDLTTWSKVKEQLPKWAGEAQGDNATANSTKNAQKMNPIARSLQAVAVHLGDEDLVFSGFERKELLLELERLGDALEKQLHIELTVIELPQEQPEPQPA